MANDRIKIIEGGPVTVGHKKKTPGGWLNGSSRPRTKGVDDLRDRIGWSHASNTSSTFDTPNSHYSFYASHRQLYPEQYWQLYKTTPDVRACVDTIVRRIATWDWYVKVNSDPRDTEEYQRLTAESERVRDFLAKPNHDGTTWQEMMTALVTDLMVYDAGVIELVNDDVGRLSELQVWLGSEWFPVTDSHGRLLYYEQQAEDSFETPVQVTPENLAYFKLYNNTRSNLGLPILETIINECLTALLSSEHAMLAMDADEIPPGLLVLGGVAGQAAERARADMMALKGKDHRIRVVTSPQPNGIEAKWLELRHTPKDLELMSVVEQMRRAIWRTFGVMPVELGETTGVPRAAAEIQMDVSSSHLISPILELLQARINAQIVSRIVDPDDREKLSFTFDRVAPTTSSEKLETAKRAEILLKKGVMTVNEVRAEMGYMPIAGGDIAIVETSLGPMPLEQVSLGLSPAMTVPADGQYAGLADEGAVPGDEGGDGGSTVVVEPDDEMGQELIAPPVTPQEGLDRVFGVRAKYESIDFSVPKGVITELGRGLEWNEEGHGGDGLQPETVSWARRMYNGQDISPDKARKMRAWLARHEVDKKGKGYNPGEKGYPSAGRVAWALWGGDAAVAWSNKLVRQMEAEEGKSTKDKHPEGCDCNVHSHPGPKGSDWRDKALSDHGWLPSDWQPAGKFKGYRTLDLKKLATTVEDYTREISGLYVDTANEIESIVASHFQGRTLSVVESQRAQDKVDAVLSAFTTKWSMLSTPHYIRAARLGYEKSGEFAKTSPDINPVQMALAYHNDAILYLQDSSGLVGSLREKVQMSISAATLSQRGRADTLEPGDPEALIAAIDGDFAAERHRVKNWSGKLVALATIVLVAGLRSVASVFEGDVNVWYYEWVAESGRNCPTCAVEGAQGFRLLQDISMYPAEGTQCGANCRCVLVMWRSDEIDRGEGVHLSSLYKG